MSSLVFPLSQIYAYIKNREPYFDVRVDEAVSGKEVRSSWWTTPRQKFKLAIDVLRSDANQPNFQKAVTHQARHFGQLDSFLLQDPEDNRVSSMGFAVGDGSTVSFQLQRSLLGALYDGLSGTTPDAAGGPAIGTAWPMSSTPRTNLLLDSQDYTQAAWLKAQTKISGSQVQVLAPDGTATADQVIENTASSAHYVQQVVTETPSTVYILSAFVLPNNRNVQVQISTLDGVVRYADFDLVNGVVMSGAGTSGILGSGMQAVGGGWFRVWIVVNSQTGSNATNILIACNNGSSHNPSYAGDGMSGFYVWGAQLEAVGAGYTSSTTPTQYIATAATSVTVNPAYWPAYTDGFQPVYELNGPVTINIAGDWQGSRQLYLQPRKNLCLQSQTFPNATWTKTSLTDGGAVSSPDGGSNAEKYTATAGGATITQSISGLTAGLVYTVGVWLQCAAGTTLQIGTTEGNATAVSLTSTWQRVTWTFTAAGASTTFTIGANASWGNTVIINVFGAQLEVGTAATSYIVTTTAAVTYTDYTLPGLGSVTFTTAPPAGAVLTWSGSYFWRVRFLNQNLPFDRIVKQMWTTGVDLVSVKP